MPGLPFFASKVQLGPEGVARVEGLGALSDFEKASLEAMLPELKAQIQKAGGRAGDLWGLGAGPGEDGGEAREGGSAQAGMRFAVGQAVPACEGCGPVPVPSPLPPKQPQSHTRTHTRAHAHTHARTHARTLACRASSSPRSERLPMLAAALPLCLSPRRPERARNRAAAL